MQGDKDIFHTLKNSPEYYPNEKFVSDTKRDLISKAKKIDQRARKNNLIVSITGVAVILILLTYGYHYSSNNPSNYTIHSQGPQQDNKGNLGHNASYDHDTNVAEEQANLQRDMEYITDTIENLMMNVVEEDLKVISGIKLVDNELIIQTNIESTDPKAEVKASELKDIISLELFYKYIISVKNIDGEIIQNIPTDT